MIGLLCVVSAFPAAVFACCFLLVLFSWKNRLLGVFYAHLEVLLPLPLRLFFAAAPRGTIAPPLTPPHGVYGCHNGPLHHLFLSLFCV